MKVKGVTTTLVSIGSYCMDFFKYILCSKEQTMTASIHYCLEMKQYNKR